MSEQGDDIIGATLAVAQIKRGRPIEINGDIGATARVAPTSGVMSPVTYPGASFLPMTKTDNIKKIRFY